MLPTDSPITGYLPRYIDRELDELLGPGQAISIEGWGVSRFLDRVYSLCDLSHDIGCGLRFPHLARGLVSQG